MFEMESNVDEVSMWLETQIEGINQGLDNAIYELTKLTYESVKQYCINANLNNHLDNIEFDYDEINKVGTVKTSDKVIIFKEMGTGVVYEGKTTHPLIDEWGWEYDINHHGESGWWYPTDESDPNPHKWIDKEGNLRAWTKGLPANCMFYNAFENIKKYVDSTISVEIQMKTKE